MRTLSLSLVLGLALSATLAGCGKAQDPLEQSFFSCVSAMKAPTDNPGDARSAQKEAADRCRALLDAACAIRESEECQAFIAKYPPRAGG